MEMTFENDGKIENEKRTEMQNTCQNLMPMQKFRSSRQSKEMTGC